MRRLLMLSLCMLLACTAFAAEFGPGVVTVTLPNAVDQQGYAAAGKLFDNFSDLTLKVSYEQGAWGRVWGRAKSFNQGEHWGRVAQADITDRAVVLDIEMKLLGDSWVKGARGYYHVVLTRGADGTVTGGTYRGTFRGSEKTQTVGGEVVASVFPLPQPPQGFAPVQPGEHPRLLFRKADLPKLRDRVKTTAFGQACYASFQAAAAVPDSRNEEQMQEKVIALGMLYQLDGDRKYADAAKAPIATLLEIGFHSGPNSLPEPYGWNASTLAYAYDLCCDGWDDAYRRDLAGKLGYWADRLINRPYSVCFKFNMDPGSNYQPGTRGGGSIAALALWGEPGPQPQPPYNPGQTPAALAPTAGYTPPAGVPVNALTPGTAPRQWLWVGPFNVETQDDVLAAVGGRDTVRPTLDMAVTFRGETSTFRPVDAVAITTGIEYPKLTKARGTTSCFYTVVDNDRERLVRLQTGHGNVRLWVNGRFVREGSYVRLQPGRYPLLMQFAVGPSFGILAPAFVEVSEAEAVRELGKQYAEYEAELTDYQDDLAFWTRSGGADPNLDRLLGAAQATQARYYEAMMGDGGFQSEGEGYTQWSMPQALESAHCYRTMFGRNWSPRPNMSHFGARYLEQYVFGGRDGGAMLAFGTNNNGWLPNTGAWIRMLSSTDAPYRPAALWALHWAMAKTDMADKPFANDMHLNVGGARDAAYLLAVYPTDLTPKHPAAVLPRFWPATGWGFFAMRNGWAGTDDIVAQITYKAAEPNGWHNPEAGSLRIMGLGKKWAIVAPGNPKSGERQNENVVLLPDGGYSGKGQGTVTFWQGTPDGSGITAGDLSRIHYKDVDGKRVYPVPALRSFAADYSGASGAPALFALVDKVGGAEKKVWAWQVPEEATVTTGAHGFTLTQGDATLTATFITPGTVAVQQVGGRLEVTGGDDYFVVMTLQRGPAPTVTVAGDGLTTVATVGKQTVRFDGGKLVLGVFGK